MDDFTLTLVAVFATTLIQSCLVVWFAAVLPARVARRTLEEFGLDPQEAQELGEAAEGVERSDEPVIRVGDQFVVIHPPPEPTPPKKKVGEALVGSAAERLKKLRGR